MSDKKYTPPPLVVLFGLWCLRHFQQYFRTSVHERGSNLQL